MASSNTRIHLAKEGTPIQISHFFKKGFFAIYSIVPIPISHMYRQNRLKEKNVHKKTISITPKKSL